MKLPDVRIFCELFYRRFSALNLEPFQLRFFDSQGLVSIAIINKKEKVDSEAVIVIDENSIYLLQINCFENIDVYFTYDSPLELYTNLLILMLLCCKASGIHIPPTVALSVTLGHEINTWRELVIYLCSLLPEEQGFIWVQENNQNALKLLKTTFQVWENVLITDGLYRRQTPYKNTLELIRAVLDDLSTVLKVYGYIIDPFFVEGIRDMYRLS